MAAPVRLQLSRRRGFNLQALSQATNGLPAVKVDRSSKFGNPNRVGDKDPKTGRPMTAMAAVDRFRDYLASARRESTEDRGGLVHHHVVENYYAAQAVDVIKRELRGKNLACWCGTAGPCHADVLLDIANKDGF